MPKLIISYRRADSDAIAGRIRDRLAGHYGETSVYMDIDSIPFGIDFRDHIRDALFDCDILLVVIGPGWLGAAKGRRPRISEETDPVRIEVETAIERGIPVIPILVGGALMPKPSDLPASLTNFAFRNAAEVDGGRDFHAHMDRLIRSMDRMLQSTKTSGAGSDRLADQNLAHPEANVAKPAATIGQPLSPPATATPTDAPAASVQHPGSTIKSGRARWLLALAMGAVLVAGGAIWLAQPVTTPVPQPAEQASATPPPSAPPEVSPAQPPPPTAAIAQGCQSSSATFYDNFKTADPGWSVDTQGFYANGQFVIKSGPDKGWANIYRSFIYKNATICVDVETPASVDDDFAIGGLVFWATDYRNYYTAAVTTSGGYRIRRRFNGEWREVTEVTAFEGIRQGYGVLNRIRVTTVGDIATVYFNDRKAQDIRGQPASRGGSVGFFGASATKSVTEWRYLNIAVVELPASQSAGAFASEKTSEEMLAKCKLGPKAQFSDDFKVPDPSWSSHSSDQVYTSEGRLKIKSLANKVSEALYLGLIFKDLTICAEIKSPSNFKDEKDTAGGVVFWAAGFKDYYSARIYPSGQYTIERLVNGEYVTINFKTTAAAIVKGPNAINRLKVVLNGSNGELFINDVKIRDFRGQPPAEGSSVGLVGDSETERRTEWSFTGIVVVENSQ